MKGLYEKSELSSALVWIVTYCALQSLANPLNKMIGTQYSVSAVFCILQSIVMVGFLKRNGLFKQYGLCKSVVPAAKFLYYIPLFILATGNLWNGAVLKHSPADTACRIACMLCVGFLEEVIFRGFLFKALAKENVRTAILVSSVTFGLGHILNLINGSGTEFADNLWQVIVAIAIGLLFVLLFYFGGSLIPCILTHSAINVLSTFAKETGLTVEKGIALHLIMLAVIGIYSLILIKTFPGNPD